MRGRDLIIAIFLGLAATGLGVAQVPGPVTGTWTLASAVVSQYMFRGLRYGGPAFQPDLEFDQGNVALGLWGSTPLAAKVPGQSDPEIDGYAWYKFVWSDEFNIQPGFTVYTYPRAEPVRGYYRATFEPNLALNYTCRGVTFTPKVYYDMVARGPTYELNAVSALPLKSLGTELDLNAAIGMYEWRRAIAEAAPGVRASGSYWQVGVTVPYQITRRSKVSAGFAYTEGTDGHLKQGIAPRMPNPSVAHRGFVTFQYSVTF